MAHSISLWMLCNANIRYCVKRRPI